MEEQAQPNNNSEIFPEFPEVKHVEPCSWNKCPQGHTWPPTVALARCGGCGGPVIATKMENCPVCNEPPEEIQLRHDHVPAKAGIQKVCVGEPSRGEVNLVNMSREHFKEVEGVARGESTGSTQTGS